MAATKPAETDDAHLINGALSGDQACTEALVAKYQSAVLALALERVGNMSAAEEVVQEVMVSAVQKLTQLKDHARFAGWLRAIALRQCGAWHRARRRHSDLRARVRAASSVKGSTETPPEIDGGEFDIVKMIEDLPKGMRAASVLCFQDGLAPSAAADVLGVRPGTLRKRLRDARAILQRRIVEKAEARLALPLLPAGFARRCVCRCKRAGKGRERKVALMKKKQKKSKGCDCGCDSKGKGKTKGGK
ncbi:MAG: RNA polymerase sigma factor [Planctomycetota bacterium]|jgi:RNA polymerase sigma-70 factor (ECF subfamily)